MVLFSEKSIRWSEADNGLIEQHFAPFFKKDGANGPLPSKYILLVKRVHMHAHVRTRTHTHTHTHTHQGHVNNKQHYKPNY